MTRAYLAILWGIIVALHACFGQQLSRLELDDDDLDTGIPGRLPPGISPPGESPSGSCCAGLPVATPMPEIPFPICPGGLPPLFSPDGGGFALSCLPNGETCPPNSACWYSGIDYYCCPMEGAPGYGYGPARPRPIGGYGGVRPPSDGGGRPSGGARPPGSFPVGVNPPSDNSGESSLPGSLPKGISPPSDNSGEVSPPGTRPNGVNPPSSGESAGPPGTFPKGVRPPGSSGRGFPNSPWKKKPRLQPPPFASGTFPNPFSCCNGAGFHPPAHLPRNINAPSERAIGYIQFHGGHNIWPPKETGKAKFGGPIKPDFLWFPGHHPHFPNELTCCGEGSGGGYAGASPSPPSGYGRPQSSIAPPADE